MPSQIEDLRANRSRLIKCSPRWRCRAGLCENSFLIRSKFKIKFFAVDNELLEVYLFIFFGPVVYVGETWGLDGGKVGAAAECVGGARGGDAGLKRLGEFFLLNPAGQPGIPGLEGTF